MNVFPWTRQSLDDVASGRHRVYSAGRCVPYRLNGDDRRRYERATRVGFIDVRGRQNAVNCYIVWCGLHSKPLIKIRPFRKYSNLCIDMSYAGWKLDRSAVYRIQALRAEWAPLGLEATEADSLDPDCAVNFDMLRRVRNGHAETVAFRLWEIALDCREAVCSA